MAITAEILQPLLDDIRNLKHSIRSAAAELGISPFRFRSAVKRLGLQMPPRNRVAAILTEYYSRSQLESISTSAVAKELGVTQPAISNALKSLGLSNKRRQASADETITKCESILEYIRCNGGTVPAARKALGLQVDLQTVRNYARLVDFNLAEYRLAYQQYGSWIIQPGVPEPCYTCDYRVKALCTRCGTVHDSVMLTNLRAGSSKGCHLCSGSLPVAAKVRCVETGKVYRSIRRLCLDLGLEKKYQTLRLKLRKQGQLLLDGKTYVLLS